MSAPKVHPWWQEKYASRPELWPIYEDFKVYLHLVWKHLGLPKPTPVQLDMADYLQHGPRRSIIMGFRGVGKSYVTVAFVTWLLLRDPDESIMVVSAGEDRATAFSVFVKRLIDEMDILKHLKAKPGQRTSVESFDVGPARAKGSPSVKSVGITGQLTGSRAGVIIPDDIEVPKNSETQKMRDKLAGLVTEFDAVLKPGGSIKYLGTPQIEQSLYNLLQERGYEVRIWPSVIPDQAYYDRMGHKLAPFVHLKIKNGHPYGESLDPLRFTDDDLAERRLSYGNSGYALQFLLDTSLSDAERYPLKLKDLIVMSLDNEKGPASVVWGPKPSQAINDVVTPGLDGDGFYRPAFIDEKNFLPYTGSVMFVDPSGKGKDETTWAIAKMLHATVFIPRVVGTQGGYDDAVLSRIAQDAKSYDVNLILVEENFGQGMFENLLKPHLARIGHKCAVEGVRNTKQKEARIIDTLEPIMNQHRLVMAESVLREDDEMIQGYPDNQQRNYRLFYQMTRLTKDKDCLAHDDRLDALAGAVAYWVDALARDAVKAAEAEKEKLMEKELKSFFADQIHAVHRGPNAARRARKKRKDGFTLSM